MKKHLFHLQDQWSNQSEVTKKRTPDKSTPVRAATAGGSWLTNLLISEVVRSAPPSKTISSVLASGAATSAAIYNNNQ